VGAPVYLSFPIFTTDTLFSIENISHDMSYLPFLYPSQDNDKLPKGRRTFGVATEEEAKACGSCSLEIIRLTSDCSL
jgi:hypothetical protein